MTRQGEIEIGQKVGHGKVQTVRLGTRRTAGGSVKRKQPQRLPRKWQISPAHMSGEGDYKCKWIGNTKGGFIVISRLS